MSGRVLAAAAAAVVTIGAGAEPPDGAKALRNPACELGGADRSRTPSVRCMTCHDGTGAGGVEFYMGARGTAMSHPVDVDYAAVATRHPDRYEARAALPPEVPLVDGRVACTSCHDGASPDPKQVAIPQRLCQSCHKL